MLNQSKAAIMAISRPEVKGECPKCYVLIAERAEAAEWQKSQQFSGEQRKSGANGKATEQDGIEMTGMWHQPFCLPFLQVSLIHLVA